MTQVQDNAKARRGFCPLSTINVESHKRTTWPLKVAGRVKREPNVLLKEQWRWSCWICLNTAQLRKFP